MIVECTLVTRPGKSNFVVGYDKDAQMIEIQGIKYAMEMFDHLRFGEIGGQFEITHRKDGVVTLKRIGEGSVLTPVASDDAKRNLIVNCTAPPMGYERPYEMQHRTNLLLAAILERL